MADINYHGIIPAIAVPFNDDHSIDQPELQRFARWLGVQPGITALMTNGHTGEVFSLTARERAEVTRMTAEAVEGICPVISSVVCEGRLGQGSRRFRTGHHAAASLVTFRL